MSFSLLSWNYVILLRIFIFQTFFQSRFLSTSHYTLVVFQPTISNEIWWTKKMLDGKQLKKKTTTQTKRLKAETRKTNKQIETQTRYCEVSSVSGTHYYNSHHRVKTLFIFLLSFPILFILLFFLSVYGMLLAFVGNNSHLTSCRYSSSKDVEKKFSEKIKCAFTVITLNCERPLTIKIKSFSLLFNEANAISHTCKKQKAKSSTLTRVKSWMVG